MEVALCEGNQTAESDAALERTALALVSEPFPAVQAGSEVLRDHEIVRLVDVGTFGKYRVQRRGESLPRGEERAVEVTVRDTDFAVP